MLSGAHADEVVSDSRTRSAGPAAHLALLGWSLEFRSSRESRHSA
jgi:hypothetical protein